MHDRTFEDRTGVVWRVSEMPADSANGDEARERRRQLRSALRLSPKDKRLTTRSHAWLYFESSADRRRVSSVPNRWMQLSDAELEDLMAYSRPLGR
jgi:hypothetical protein